MNADSLKNLLDELTRGDAHAAEQVFLAYEPILRMVVRRQLPARLRSKFDSVDIVQSVWADLVKGFREAGWRFADVAHLQSFLIKMTRHRFIDFVRRHKVETSREETAPVESAPCARNPRPSQVILADELWERMLAICPPAHRELLRLKRLGLSAREISDRTGLHEDSVHRVLRNLARHIAFRSQAVASS